MACVGAGIAATYVVVGCTLVAPKHKKWVAIAAYALGASAAGYMGRSLEEYAPMVVALLVGAIAAILMNRRYAIAPAA